MSKKNKLKTRDNSNKFAVKREKEATEKKEKKAAKAQAKAQATLHEMQGVGKKTVSATSKVKKAMRLRRGPRIVKGAVIQGIKVTDAESKIRIRELLEKKAFERMQLDSDEDVQADAAEACPMNIG